MSDEMVAISNVGGNRSGSGNGSIVLIFAIATVVVAVAFAASDVIVVVVASSLCIYNQHIEQTSVGHLMVEKLNRMSSYKIQTLN